MGWAEKAIVGTVLVVTGFVVGAATTDNPPPTPPPVVKEVPKYIEREVKVEKRVMPQSCRDLVAAAKRADAAVDTYENALGSLPRMLDDAYRGIYNRDLDLLNDLKQKEIKLEQASIQALLDMRDSRERVAKLTAKCDADMAE